MAQSFYNAKFAFESAAAHAAAGTRCKLYKLDGLWWIEPN